MDSFRDRFLNELARSPLSEQSRAHHRNLLVAGSIAIVIAALNLIPEKISALGVDLQSSDQKVIRIALLVVVVYFTAAFLSYAVMDAAAWQGTHRAAREGGMQARSSIQKAQDDMDHLLPALESDPTRTTTSWATFESIREQMLDSQRRSTLYRVMVPTDLVRAFIDFAVPMIVAVTAITWLLIRLI